MEADDLAEVINERLKAQGICVFSVKDGHVFTFTLGLLEKLVERAERGDGKVVLFVQTGLPQ